MEIRLGDHVEYGDGAVYVVTALRDGAAGGVEVRITKERTWAEAWAPAHRDDPAAVCDPPAHAWGTWVSPELVTRLEHDPGRRCDACGTPVPG